MMHRCIRLISQWEIDADNSQMVNEKYIWVLSVTDIVAFHGATSLSSIYNREVRAQGVLMLPKIFQNGGV